MPRSREQEVSNAGEKGKPGLGVKAGTAVERGGGSSKYRRG